MKLNMPVTDNEIELSDYSIITSTTDLKGAITCVNLEFIDISGFTEEELLGKNHNMVRHPDMPPAAFENLWGELKAGNPWMGIVKNRCKNGDYYWVDAFVCPVTRNGEVIGYQSIRFKANKVVKERAEALYKSISAGKKLKLKTLGFLPKQILTGVVLQLFAFASLVMTGILSLPVATSVWLGISLIWAGVTYYQMRDFQKLLSRSKNIVNNKITQLAYYGKIDDVSQVRLAIKMSVAKLKAVIKNVAQSSEQLSERAKIVSTDSLEVFTHVTNQQKEIELIATAANEMSAAVQEVSQSTVKAMQASQNVKEQTAQGSLTITDAIGIIDSLDSQVSTSASSILELKKDSESIGGVLEVIRGIAEQTNLLALNAAIEAARAGEQGRGFAVVADEVRTLASRSHDSTQDIQQMIEKLQHGVNAAAKDMDAVKARATQGVEQVEAAAEALAEISGSINMITDMNTQIATATEEQKAVVDDISRNIEGVNQMATETANGANQNMISGDKMLEVSNELHLTVENIDTTR